MKRRHGVMLAVSFRLQNIPTDRLVPDIDNTELNVDNILIYFGL